MDYRKFFKGELEFIYSEEEIHLLFKILVAHLKQKEFASVFADEMTLNPSEECRFYEAVIDLKALKPIQHVTGRADFYGLKFTVNPDVLIPRPETEELVHLIVTEQKNKTITIIDIGTGSGCIAISLKKNLPLAEVSAVDISSEALYTARQNAAEIGTPIMFYEDDALHFNAKNYPKYDVIISNPPYIAMQEKVAMDNLVLDNEPHLALFVADEEALIFYDKIADFALTNLKPNGTLYFEINQNLARETKDLVASKGFKADLIKDLNDNFRMLRAQLLG